jgi:hypothetical protein
LAWAQPTLDAWRNNIVVTPLKSLSELIWMAKNFYEYANPRVPQLYRADAANIRAECLFNMLYAGSARPNPDPDRRWSRASYLSGGTSQKEFLIPLTASALLDMLGTSLAMRSPDTCAPERRSGECDHVEGIAVTASLA